MNEIIFKKIFELFLGGQIRQNSDFGSAQFFHLRGQKDVRFLRYCYSRTIWSSVDERNSNRNLF